MKKLTIILTLMFLSIGCGQGPTGAKGENGVSVTPSAGASLEGYFLLPNGGYIDIYQDGEGLYSVRQARIVVTNADGSSGVLPLNSIGALPMVGGYMYYNPNLSYVAATHNVKQDSNNALLNGSLLTELIFGMSNGKLQIQIIVNSPSGVLFNHVVQQ